MKWWSIAVLCAACGGELAVPPLPEPVEIRDGDQRAAGSIAGQLWQVGDARFRIVTRDGRQRVDLLFWDAPIERCGLPLEREGTLVWVRFAGRTELPEGEYRLESERGEFEVHYELPGEDGIREEHRGVAHVRVDASESRSIRGRLSVCFADVERSCVEGSFDARPCESRIDGRAIREPPGLIDEALER